MKEREGKTLFVRFKPIDRLRLTRLRVWCWRYHIELDELLSLVLPYLRKSITTQQKARFGLGVSIAALTGIGAEKILIEALKQKYPGGEYIEDWRERERNRQLLAERTEDMDGLRPARFSGPFRILDAESPSDYLKSYRQRVTAKRDSLRSAQSDKSRRKPYRFNPWR